MSMTPIEKTLWSIFERADAPTRYNLLNGLHFAKSLTEESYGEKGQFVVGMLDDTYNWMIELDDQLKDLENARRDHGRKLG